MKKTTKKIIISGTLAAAITASATLSGCGLVSTNSFKDLGQVIATVNVAQATDFDSELEYYKSAVDVTAEIQKRELITYFVNYGYSYIQNYNYSYKQVFELLVDSLVSNSIMTQYATLYLLNEKAKENGNTEAAKAAALAEFVDANKTQAQKYESLLSDEDIKIAKYSLMSSLNSAIDAYETQLIKEKDSSAGSDSRSTPGKVDTEKEDYYPRGENGEVNYAVYTGFNTVDVCGTYKTDRSDLLQKYSTRAKRINAYNRFISGLAGYNLVDAETEELRNIESLQYYKDEYLAYLEQRIVEKYYDVYEEKQEKKLNDDENYNYVNSVYNELLSLQEETYEDEDDFNGVLGNLSDSSFLLYSPEAEGEGAYGYVYNILLPFSQAQSIKLTEYQSIYADSDNDDYKPEFYTKRNELLGSIVGYDQRTPWFNGTTEYAFKSSGVQGTDYYGNSEWLFFENNLTNNDRYEKLEKYAGKYAFNGKVVEKKDEREDYVLYTNPVTIDDLVNEFSDYIDFVLGSEKVEATVKQDYYKVYTEENLYKDVKEKEIDYSNFLYASGKVKFAETNEAYNRVNVLNPESEQYKALSAVNELQYAYTTDNSVLSQYLGYSVQVGDTSYIKEFEYAAHEALERGAGAFSICGGNYGWHLIYVTYTFSAGEVQHAPNWSENVGVEGTFENLFYEWIKSTAISDISTKRRSEIIEKYNSDSTVTKYVDRYQDLLDIDSD